MEVNARLQVEHPVTEATTGLDLVKLQLRVAAGGAAGGRATAAARPRHRGPAVRGGPRAGLRAGARADRDAPPADRERACASTPGSASATRSPTEFDSMIAKIIAWGQDRDEALARLRRALAQSTVVVEGGTTNRSFLLGLLDRPEMVTGDYDNRWLDRITAAGEHVPAPQPVALLAAAVEAYAADHAASQAAFHAGARRGRPEMPETIGARLRLRYAGATHDLWCLPHVPGHLPGACGQRERRPRGRLRQRLRAPGPLRGPSPPRRGGHAGCDVPDRRGRHHPPDHPRRRRRRAGRVAGLRGLGPRAARGPGRRGRPGRGAGEHEDGVHGHGAVLGRGDRGRGHAQRPGQHRCAAAAHP